MTAPGTPHGHLSEFSSATACAALDGALRSDDMPYFQLAPHQTRQRMLRAYQEYLELKAHDPGAAKRRTHVGFAYIPNLSEAAHYRLVATGSRLKNRWRLW